MPQAIYLLPEGARFGAQRLSTPVASMLGRGDASVAAAGRRAQLRRHFLLPPAAWPMAALSRQLDADDAADAVWLRADPVYLRPDSNGVRLLAHGDALGLDREDVDALLPALKPLFGDAGCLLDAPAPDRWYLRLPLAAPLPAFSDPREAMGEDLFEHVADGPEGSRWRTLFNAAQILLHQHPRNAERLAAGRLPVNALWFWGGGRLPDAQGAQLGRLVVFGEDATLRAAAASVGFTALPGSYPDADRQDDALFDLGAMRDLAALDRDWLQPALHRLQQRGIDRLLLDAEDGRRWTIDRGHRWRVWRRPFAGFSA